MMIVIFSGKVLLKQGVEQFDPLSEQFDPKNAQCSRLIPCCFKTANHNFCCIKGAFIILLFYQAVIINFLSDYTPVLKCGIIQEKSMIFLNIWFAVMCFFGCRLGYVVHGPVIRLVLST